MTSAAHASSAYLEKLYDIPLQRALKLAPEFSGLVDEIDSLVTDRCKPDRVLLEMLAHRLLETGDGDLTDELKMTNRELQWFMIELADRLLAALDEANQLVIDDHRSEVSRYIVKAAVEEGRIPRQEAL